MKDCALTNGFRIFRAIVHCLQIQKAPGIDGQQAARVLGCSTQSWLLLLTLHQGGPVVPGDTGGNGP